MAVKEQKQKRSLRDYKRRQAIKLRIFESKGGKCEHCSLRDLDHLEIYEYHHTDPTTKILNVGSSQAHSLEKILKEAEKCLLLCANCHNIEHGRINKEKYE